MRRLMLILLLLALAVPLSAGTITINFGSPLVITTTAAQDAKLTRALALYNAETGKSLGMEQFIKQMIIAGVEQFVNKVNETEQLEACTTFNTLGASAKNQILTALGGKNPCR